MIGNAISVKLRPAVMEDWNRSANGFDLREIAVCGENHLLRSCRGNRLTQRIKDCRASSVYGVVCHAAGIAAGHKSLVLDGTSRSQCEQMAGAGCWPLGYHK